MILLLSLLVLVACMAYAAPATSSQPRELSHPTQNVTDPALSLQTPHSVPLSMVPITSPLSVASASLLNLTHFVSPYLSQADNSSNTISVTSPLSLVSSSPPLSSTLSSPPLSSTLSSFPAAPMISVSEVATISVPSAINVTPSSTVVVTVVVTVTAPPAVTTTTSLPWSNHTQWVAPPQMTDISAFNVTYFPSGQRNLHIVAQVPAQAIAPTAKSKFLQSAADTDAPTVLQLVYPAHSVNPARKPEGGADFYATPLNLAGARNVTLEYSVLFPADFDWVKGGKLPGLFGGHTGCSGGASAQDCFSTRLMWRPQGIGELYLYAPKDKQTDTLCADIGSVCDALYGFSIGRGAFNFTAGDWTHLQQNVVLNTPGRSDGSFTLLVDGRLAINRADVFYRDAVWQPKQSLSAFDVFSAFSAPPIAAQRSPANVLDDQNEDNPQPAEFIGLFFSTFFGGHGKQYATPKEQYTWFKDFVITRHD